MNLFDILGPVMVGPSSSHTAGAVRIGYISGKLLQDHVVKAEILLHGSFATTGIGHGTDKALIAGLLGMRPDDIRIPDSFFLAKKDGMEFSFSTITLKDAHPNTAVLRLTGEHGRKIEVQAASIGGGRILIAKLDGIEVNFSAEKPTLIVHNVDQPGHVAHCLPYSKAFLRFSDHTRGGSADRDHQQNAGTLQHKDHPDICPCNPEATVRGHGQVRRGNLRFETYSLILKQLLSCAVHSSFYSTSTVTR